MKRKIRRGVGWCMFVVYIAALLYVMFFSEDLGRTGAARTYRYNLVLFKEIKRFIYNYQNLGLMAVLLNVAGNILVFMPFGFMLPILTSYKGKFVSALFGTFALSLFIETTQLIFRVGCFDVDDLLLNTVGGVLGYIVYAIRRMYLKHKYKRK